MKHGKCSSGYYTYKRRILEHKFIRIVCFIWFYVEKYKYVLELFNTLISIIKRLTMEVVITIRIKTLIIFFHIILGDVFLATKRILIAARKSK